MSIMLSFVYFRSFFCKHALAFHTFFNSYAVAKHCSTRKLELIDQEITILNEAVDLSHWFSNHILFSCLKIANDESLENSMLKPALEPHFQFDIVCRCITSSIYQIIFESSYCVWLHRNKNKLLVEIYFQCHCIEYIFIHCMH